MAALRTLLPTTVFLTDGPVQLHTVLGDKVLGISVGLFLAVA